MDEFERRLKIIEALEVTKDDAALSALIREDKNLEAYGNVLVRVSCSLKDKGLLKKLLDLPVLRPSSRAYKKAVAETFSEIAANKDDDTDDAIVALLFDRIKGDQKIKDTALSFIFSTVVSHGITQPDIKLTKLLVQNGANVQKAAQIHEWNLEADRLRAEKKVTDFQKFKADILQP